jgi:hypothetical protein
MRKVYIGFMAVLAAAYVGRAQTRGVASIRRRCRNC